MAKTKITARKSTGGDTPRRQLVRKGGGGPIVTAAAARPTVSPYPRRSPLLKLAMTTSSEPRATVSSEPQTGLLLEPPAGGSLEPDTHEAFYGLNSNPEDPHSWVPALPQYISLVADYSLSKQAHISNTSTLILHLCLQGIQSRSLPVTSRQMGSFPKRLSKWHLFKTKRKSLEKLPRTNGANYILLGLLRIESMVARGGGQLVTLPLYLLQLALQEYISAPSLGFIEQVYDFTNGIDEPKPISYDRVVVFITTHAHDTTGDLYGGPEFSALPYDVLTALFPSALRKAFKNRTIYLNFLVCGGFADTDSSRMALYKAAHKVHANEAIAFLSPGLIPTLTNVFWLDFTIRVLIEGYSLDKALPYMLTATSTSSFVRHTNLLYVRISTSQPKAALSSEFVWTHPELRPFGRRLPANCAECGCIDTFGSPIKLTPKAGSKCLHELAVEPMEGFETYGKSQNGSWWMVRTANTILDLEVELPPDIRARVCPLCNVDSSDKYYQ
ncbi:hypothetical protein FIBSPDRAFT_881511 [Athelia psychrophila]|uniref:Uncharacterized protein n=1 Tax=Athelia psychrophila TaxID=1759441 RepID=A0A166WS99_9AGAM|nr:hypothetical protein FIBSPDRAFT_881511 [Fibularhizoctonia sp. CBS 109695]